MKSLFAILIAGLFTLQASAQDIPVTLTTPTGDLKGSMEIPTVKGKMPVVLIIAGSGPTDRNGNQVKMTNNAYKMLADSLNTHGIASLRYDKRGVAESLDSNLKMENMRFENYVADANEWVNLLGKDKRFSKIIIAGHSEGSLIGMLVAENNKKVSGYISIAGPGRAADVLIKEQLKDIPQPTKDEVFPKLDSLKKGDTVRDVPYALYSLMRPEVQPYIKSWFKYDPKTEIARLTIPMLIVQGDKDIQVPEADARLLKEGNSKADVKIIGGMTHVFKNATTMDKFAQLDIYRDPNLPVNTEMVKVITVFVKDL